MISTDQPTCFPENVLVAVSSREDGSVLDRTRDNRHDPEMVENRRRFCAASGLEYDQCVYQIISYDDGNTFDTIGEVTRPDSEGVHADVLYTETPGVGMFLPIADCVGTVVYDSVRHALALAHIGRHASVAKTLTKTIEFFKQKGSDVQDITIWMAPSVAKHDYILTWFDHLTDEDWEGFVSQEQDGIHLDLSGLNKALAVRAGVPEANIYVSNVNTATDPHYFSHSQGDTNGRFAVVAQLR
ncbi:TPA: hypothetical protein DIV49_03640 [Candidatus Saccharibacteria bacterium]|nr:hypothetical protein [Candidatus Saccharibacteria bacterium]HRJ91319.1 laccase domain-containing protein [Candidatus Saccharibacteria bacterium]